MKWLEKENPQLDIQHALSKTGNGEYRVAGTKYLVDGFDQKTNTVYEFHGSLYHGCSKCYPDENITLPKTGETRKVLFTKTIKKEKIVKALGYKLVVIWEHEFKKQIYENEELQNVINKLDLEPRLNPRDSFFGGRTNSCRMYYQAKEDEIIRYVDYTSLFPYTNKYAEYPTQHPIIITKDFQDIGSYFGIAKLKILPPKKLYHAVLPVLCNEKLKFPLCMKCSGQESQEPCKCTDDQSCLIGTWCTPEINKAIEVGYKVVKIYEMYHWTSTAKHDDGTGMFTGFINTFTKLKQENSGWPDWCGDDEVKRLQYIKDYERNEGILLDVSKISRNLGMRTLAKLILNRLVFYINLQKNLIFT